MPKKKLLSAQDNCIHCQQSRKPLLITQHAASRIKQRGINEVLLSLILSEGNSYYQDDCIVYRLVHRKIRQKIAKNLRSIASKLEKTTGLFAVVSADDKLITVGHDFKMNKERHE